MTTSCVCTTRNGAQASSPGRPSTAPAQPLCKTSRNGAQASSPGRLSGLLNMIRLDIPAMEPRRVHLGDHRGRCPCVHPPCSRNGAQASSPGRLPRCWWPFGRTCPRNGAQASSPGRHRQGGRHQLLLTTRNGAQASSPGRPVMTPAGRPRFLNPQWSPGEFTWETALKFCLFWPAGMWLVASAEATGRG